MTCLFIKKAWHEQTQSMAWANIKLTMSEYKLDMWQVQQTMIRYKKGGPWLHESKAK